MNQDGPQPQRPVEIEKVSIEYLCYMQNRIYFPDCQRGAVWELGRRQLLIQTILSGREIGILFAIKRISEEGVVSYGLIDGRQRFETICMYLRGAFPTAKESYMKSIEPLVVPIQPGKFFNDLTPLARSVINQYNIIIYSSSSEEDLKTQGQSFRERNRYKRVTQAQTLKSYPSKMNSIARELSGHSFWAEIYKGPKKEDECFRGSLNVLIMHLANDFVAQSYANLRDYSCGVKDDLITDDLLQTCRINLDIASHLFSKAIITAPYEMIPMYQAILFLQKDGYNLDHLEHGSFTNWYHKLQIEARQSSYAGGRSIFYKLLILEEQRYFWEQKDHLEVLKRIVKRSQKVAI